MPNYEPYQISDYGGMMDFLSPEDQGRLGMSGRQLAESYGYDPDKYGDYFTAVDEEGIKKALSALPELQQNLQGNVRQGFNQGKEGLLDKIGKGGLAGSGSYSDKFDQLDTKFTSGMLSADKEIQSLIGEVRGQATEGIGGMQDTIGMLRQTGAKKIDEEDEDGGFLGTVLCSELNRQGVMSDELFSKDSLASKSLSNTALKGYRLWAIPLVYKMRNSHSVTSFLTPFVMAFANELAGNSNLLGKFELAIGIPLCELIYSIHRLKRKVNKWLNKIH